MRAPPGDPVSMEACIETALGPADEHAVTATMVRDQINALNPNMSKLSYAITCQKDASIRTRNLREWLLIGIYVLLNSLRRRVDTPFNYRCPPHKSEIHFNYPLLPGIDSLTWSI